MILTSAEIKRLTERERTPAQRRVLDALRIPYRARPDGSLVVMSSAVELALGGVQTVRQHEPQLRA